MEFSYTAERVLRALEAIVLRPSTAPAIAAEVGVDPRTARRILRTLAEEQYMTERHQRGRWTHTYAPTVRLLAMAAQLASRLALVRDGQRGVEQVQRATGLGGYVAIPSYRHVAVIARAGERVPELWSLLPALEDAAGRLLLAYRDPWRQSFSDDQHGRRVGELEAAVIRTRGHVLVASRRNQPASLAVPVPDQEPPIAALVLHGASDAPIEDEAALAEVAHGTATRMANRSE